MIDSNALFKRIYYEHCSSYRDFSSVPPEPGYSTPNIENMTFAEKLHHMLSEKKFESLIGWMPHGRAFKVLRPGGFERRVMPMYFGHSRYSGFLSMLRQYGLKNLIKAGPDQGCLYHEVTKQTLQLLPTHPLKRH
jgi:HSF-type DNA-binding